MLSETFSNDPAGLKEDEYTAPRIIFSVLFPWDCSLYRKRLIRHSKSANIQKVNEQAKTKTMFGL